MFDCWDFQAPCAATEIPHQRPVRTLSPIGKESHWPESTDRQFRQTDVVRKFVYLCLSKWSYRSNDPLYSACSPVVTLQGYITHTPRHTRGAVDVEASPPSAPPRRGGSPLLSLILSQPQAATHP